LYTNQNTAQSGGFIFFRDLNKNINNTGAIIMRNEYNFSESVKNPYAKHLKKQVTLRLGVDVIDYFKNLADETGVPYQNLINLYLQDCAHSQKKLKWAS